MTEVDDVTSAKITVEWLEQGLLHLKHQGIDLAELIGKLQTALPLIGDPHRVYHLANNMCGVKGTPTTRENDYLFGAKCALCFDEVASKIEESTTLISTQGLGRRLANAETRGTVALLANYAKMVEYGQTQPKHRAGNDMDMLIMLEYLCEWDGRGTSEQWLAWATGLLGATVAEVCFRQCKSWADDARQGVANTKLVDFHPKSALKEALVGLAGALTNDLVLTRPGLDEDFWEELNPVVHELPDVADWDETEKCWARIESRVILLFDVPGSDSNLVNLTMDEASVPATPRLGGKTYTGGAWKDYLAQEWKKQSTRQLASHVKAAKSRWVKEKTAPEYCAAVMLGEQVVRNRQPEFYGYEETLAGLHLVCWDEGTITPSGRYVVAPTSVVRQAAKAAEMVCDELYVVDETCEQTLQTFLSIWKSSDGDVKELEASLESARLSLA